MEQQMKRDGRDATALTEQAKDSMGSGHPIRWGGLLKETTQGEKAKPRAWRDEDDA